MQVKSWPWLRPPTYIFLRTLVLTAVLVPLMVYVLIPFWTRVLSSKKVRIR